MLETVLQIGKALRASPAGLRYHRYVKKPEIQDKDEDLLILSLPVREDATFNFDAIGQERDENTIAKLFYLTFKTSDADSLVKYIFGDIYYSVSEGKEGGFYRLPNLTNKQAAYNVGSFYRGQEDSKPIGILLQKKQEIEQPFLSRFRQEFDRHVIWIERILQYHLGIAEFYEQQHDSDSLTTLLEDEERLRWLTGQRIYKNIAKERSAKRTFMKIFGVENPGPWTTEMTDKLLPKGSGRVFLHFDFTGRHWHEMTDEFSAINEKLLEDFVEEADPGGWILKKFLYKTLAFSPEARYRNKLFADKEQILDLLYAIDYSSEATIKPHRYIKIIVLPKGKGLSAEEYRDFREGSRNSLRKFQEQEQTIAAQPIAEDEDTSSATYQEALFAPILERSGENIVQFDVIFSKQAQTGPDVDLVEISGLEKSHLTRVYQRILAIKQQLEKQRCHEIRPKKDGKAKLKPLDILTSLFMIMGDNSKDKKKYQSHLCKVLPKIYTDTYYHDPLLLPVFINKVQANIRQDMPNFGLLKYNLFLLLRVQRRPDKGDNLMHLRNSSSYQLGKQLGQMARPLNLAIKSFEKSYVGNLSRRIANLADLVKFKNFIEEKLVIHEKNYPDVREAGCQLTQLIKDFSGRYDKNECAFGFFESYFKRIEKNDSAKTKDNESQS